MVGDARGVCAVRSFCHRTHALGLSNVTQCSQQSGLPTRFLCLFQGNGQVLVDKGWIGSQQFHHSIIVGTACGLCTHIALLIQSQWQLGGIQAHGLQLVPEVGHGQRKGLRDQHVLVFVVIE